MDVETINLFLAGLTFPEKAMVAILVVAIPVFLWLVYKVAEKAITNRSVSPESSVHSVRKKGFMCVEDEGARYLIIDCAIKREISTDEARFLIEQLTEVCL